MNEHDVTRRSPRDSLAKVLENLLWLRGPKNEPGNDRLERVARQFHDETGMLAPYKDQAAMHCGFPTVEERRAVYDSWLESFYVEAHEMLAEHKGGS